MGKKIWQVFLIDDGKEDTRPDWLKSAEQQTHEKLKPLRNSMIKMAKEKQEKERASRKTRVFFISPVRSNNIISQDEIDKVRAYVKKLEKEGNEVFWPLRDNPHQKTDPIGTTILNTNFYAMLDADEIHIWYVPDSRGINFDNGAVFMLIEKLGMRRKIVFVNSKQFPEEIEGKNFIKVLRALQEKTKNY